MLKTEFDFYTRLKNKRSVLLKSIATSIKESDTFKMLCDANVIKADKNIRGARCTINKLDKYNELYASKFPNADIQIRTEKDNQLKYRDTKATTIVKERVILIRGFEEVEVNGKCVDLKKATEDFSLFSTVLESLRARKVCFVENLQPFLEAEKVIGKEYVFIHFYGRFPKSEVLRKIVCEHYLHFSDYDFVGLHEYLRAAEIYKNVTLYIPDNYDDLFSKYSKVRKKKDTIYKNVRESKVVEVVKIREQVKSTNLFLEQQVVVGRHNE